MMMILALAAIASPQEMTIEAMGVTPPGSDRYYQVAAGDLDGDGVADAAVLKVKCPGGKHFPTAVIRARDAGSGMASGRRQHGSVKIVKEWDAATPMLARKVGYDVKKVEGSGARASWDLAKGKGARSAADDAGWTAVEVSPADAQALCGAPALDAASKDAAKR